ncbi:MAG: XdhC family protein [Acidobacteriota bacterium]|nr:XdhC family protein [Acidobacteriota bacterium]
MMERRRIVAMWRQAQAGVLVTLVRVEGSSYRRPGARLLIGEGVYAGSISGGCLEGEVIRKARWKVQDGARMQTYSTMFDDTAEMPFGLGCGGVVDLLFEPVATPEGTALLEAMERSLHGAAGTVLTWLPAAGRALRRAVLDAHGHVVFASGTLGEQELSAARALLPGCQQLPGGHDTSEVYCEVLVPPQRLVVLGAGDDAKPLVTMAAQLGWSVVVADGRVQLLRQERFPEAESLVATESAAKLDLSPLDAVVLMTHSYEQDRSYLAELMLAAPRYLGVLGARHRSSLLVSEVAATTGLSLAECCARIYAPVGLDLGGDGPEAIALAVLAEAQACVQGKLGASRRLSAEDVLEQAAKGDSSVYLRAQCSATGALS